MGKKEKKLKVPESIFELRWSMKKFAKKHSIALKGHGMNKKRRKEANKKLLKTYSQSAINNLNKAVKILSENQEDGKKIIKLKEGVDNIIGNGDVMNRIISIYKKDPKEYSNMIFLPYMITNTIMYYDRADLTDEEKVEAAKLDKEKLLTFCEKILKHKIRHYRKAGLNDAISFELANTVPTTKLLKNNRRWYKNLIRKLYLLAEGNQIDLMEVLTAIRKVDGKKKSITKREFYEGFFSEFILTKSTNKSLSYNDTQKELHENLIAATLDYLESLKEKKIRELLKTYIRRRKTAEEHKNDTKRVIRFIDHANSNSKYTKLKTTIQELISDNSNNELYLS